MDAIDPINPTGMAGAVELITPEIAAKYLATSAGNRVIRQRRVCLYAEARKKGKFHLSHQGIAFDESGRLFDGHHRLTMVVQSGQPTAMFVVRNVPDAGKLTTDAGLPRSVRDALKMADLGDHSHSAIATANVLPFVPKDLRPTSHQWTPEDVLRVLRTHAEAIAFAETATGRGVTRCVRAAVARAYYHVDRARLSHFVHVLNTGEVRDPESDNSAVKVRNFLLEACGVTGHPMDLERYHKVQCAIRDFARGVVKQRLTGAAEDLYPLPAASEGSPQ